MVEDSANLNIRPQRPGDLDRLVEIWQRSVEATHDFLTPEDVAFFRPRVQEGLPQAEVHVAETGAGNPVGFIALSDAHVEALFVDPDSAGQGAGTRLLQHARSLKGPLTVDVNEQNPAAWQFYRRRGFRDIGRSDLDGTGRPFPLIHMAQGKEKGDETEALPP